MKTSSRKFTRAFTLIEIMIVVLIIGILLSIAVPNFIKAREQSRSKACSANLKQIDAAKQEWAMDNKVNTSSTTTPTLDAVAATGLIGPSLYLKSTPSCPASGAYSVGTINTDPTCSVTTSAYPHTVTGK